MAQEQELRTTAHELYAQARASISPSTCRSLMKQADSLLRQAEEIRKSNIVQAAFPMPGLRFSEWSDVGGRPDPTLPKAAHARA